MEHNEKIESSNDSNVEPGELGVTAYPLVSIVNSTPFIADGDVEYMSLFCSNDHYTVTPTTTWIAKSRGVCLVTKITATVKTPSGNIKATSYTSSGTSYSQFAILQDRRKSVRSDASCYLISQVYRPYLFLYLFEKYVLVHGSS